MRYLYLITLVIFLDFSFICAQTIDKSFHEPRALRPAKIQCSKMLNNGKILIGGDITFYKDKRIKNLIRLNSDGSIDSTFNFNREGSFLVIKIDTLKTGDIIIMTRGYESLLEVYRANFSLLQLSPDGRIIKAIDTLQNTQSFAVQNDDKIVVYGGHDKAGYLYRYNTDFSSDVNFNNRVSFNSTVTSVIANKVTLFVAGNFSTVNGETKHSIVKLALDGTINESFDAGSGTSDYIGSLTLQKDGKLLLGNGFINSFGTRQYCSGMVRLNLDGTVDNGFNPPYLRAMTSEIKMRDSLIYVATSIMNSTLQECLYRLNPNGSLDTKFNPIKVDMFGFDGFCMEFTENNLIINKTSTTGNIYGLSEYDYAGNRIMTYEPEVSIFGNITMGAYFTGKLVIGGDFVKINKTKTFGVAMLNKDGSADTSFVMPDNRGIAKQIKVLNDTSILVDTEKDFFKLNTQAKIQTNFKFTPFKYLYWVDKFAMLKNGKIYAGNCNNVYRLNADGTEDNSFDDGTGLGQVSTAYDFDIQGDKVIYGSYFSTFNGKNLNKLVRLNTDGSIDTSFKTGSGPNNKFVTLIKVLDDDEVIVGGDFTSFDGVPIPNKIVKLHKDGAIDSTFLSNQNKNNFFYEFYSCKVAQINSRLYLRGKETLAELNTDGSVDNSFFIPFSINKINDIITFQDSSHMKSGSLKSAKTSYPEAYMFTIGNFGNSTGSDPAYIVKLNMGSTNTSNPTGITNIITDSNRSKFTIYPNPVSEFLKINFKEQPDDFLIVTIFNLSGVKVYEASNLKKIENSGFELNVQNLVAGVYSVKVYSGSKFIGSQVFVKVN